MNILHVAQIEIKEDSGMGRVACHWRAEMERRGHRFIHIGRTPLGREVHPALYPYAARTAADRIRPRPDLILAHEPASPLFVNRSIPLVVFSHGIERRGWTLAKREQRLSGERIAMRSRLLYPIWRLLACDRGLNKADGALVLNSEDYAYCLEHYHRNPETTFLFRNGVDAIAQEMRPVSAGRPTILFLGSWIPRKGTRTLVTTADLLYQNGIRARWLLAGTGASPSEVLSSWPSHLQADVEIVPHFDARDEALLFAQATIFVLPSFFEGQPLALLQAMAFGLPVITTNTCGQRDLLSAEANGLLFTPGDSAMFAHLLARCLSDSALRSRLGNAARCSVAARSWHEAATGVCDFIEQVRSVRRGH